MSEWPIESKYVNENLSCVVNSHLFQCKKDLQAVFDALPASERNALLGVKSHLDPSSKAQPLVSESSNEVLSVVDNASENQSLRGRPTLVVTKIRRLHTSKAARGRLSIPRRLLKKQQR